MENLNGPFNNIIPNFQKYKKSLGYKYDNISEFWRIDKILKQNGCFTLKDTKEIYKILITDEENENVKKRNYYCLKELYHFLKISGHGDFYLAPYYSKNNSNFKAHALTESEVLEFFENLDEYCKKLNNESRYIYPVLFRLVYSCGLRIMEALNLKITDFSRENKTIFIEKAKGNVDRLLPLSDSMYSTLKQYTNIIDLSKNEYLFEINNKSISYSMVQYIFEKVCSTLNFSFRIHDFRHHFTFTNFNNLFKSQYNEDWILYYLHIYLGHKTAQSTEYYLQLIPEKYKETIKKTDKAFGNLFPKVGDQNE